MRRDSASKTRDCWACDVGRLPGEEVDRSPERWRTFGRRTELANRAYRQVARRLCKANLDLCNESAVPGSRSLRAPVRGKPKSPLDVTLRFTLYTGTRCSIDPGRGLSRAGQPRFIRSAMKAKVPEWRVCECPEGCGARVTPCPARPPHRAALSEDKCDRVQGDKDGRRRAPFFVTCPHHLVNGHSRETKPCRNRTPTGLFLFTASAAARCRGWARRCGPT